MPLWPSPLFSQNSTPLPHTFHELYSYFTPYLQKPQRFFTLLPACDTNSDQQSLCTAVVASPPEETDFVVRPVLDSVLQVGFIPAEFISHVAAPLSLHLEN